MSDLVWKSQIWTSPVGAWSGRKRWRKRREAGRPAEREEERGGAGEWRKDRTGAPAADLGHAGERAGGRDGEEMRRRRQRQTRRRTAKLRRGAAVVSGAAADGRQEETKRRKRKQRREGRQEETKRRKRKQRKRGGGGGRPPSSPKEVEGRRA
jgi:hypothetical protein